MPALFDTLMMVPALVISEIGDASGAKTILSLFGIFPSSHSSCISCGSHRLGISFLRHGMMDDGRHYI